MEVELSTISSSSRADHAFSQLEAYSSRVDQGFSSLDNFESISSWLETILTTCFCLFQNAWRLSNSEFAI